MSKDSALLHRLQILSQPRCVQSDSLLASDGLVMRHASRLVPSVKIDEFDHQQFDERSVISMNCKKEFEWLQAIASASADGIKSRNGFYIQPGRIRLVSTNLTKLTRPLVE